MPPPNPSSAKNSVALATNSLRRSSGESRFCLARRTSWAGLLSHDAVLMSGNKPAVSAAGKQQRLLPVVGIGLDRAEKNDVVAAIIPVGGAALEIGDAAGKNRRIAKARRPFDPGEFVFRGFREFVGERLLRCAEHIDREMAGVLEDAQALRKHPKAPQHQRRIQRNRGERIAGQPIGLPVGRHRRDDGDAGGVGAERVAKIPRVDRRIVAGEFTGGIRIDRMLGRVGHALPQSVRFSDGRPSATRP